MLVHRGDACLAAISGDDPTAEFLEVVGHEDAGVLLIVHHQDLEVSHGGGNARFGLSNCSILGFGPNIGRARFERV